MMQYITSKRSFYIVIFVLISVTNGYSQNPEKLLAEMKSLFPEKRMVQFDRKHHYIFTINKNELEVYLKEQRKIIFLKNPSGMDPTQSLYTSIMNELVDFEANSYIPSGKKYKKVAIKEFKEKSNVEQYSFYDDIKELSFTFPGIGEGTILELNSTHKINEPRLLPTTYLTSFTPVKNMEVVFESDDDIEYDMIFINDAQKHCKFETTEKRGKTIRSCALNNLPEIKNEEHQPDLTYFEPHIITKINGYSVNGTGKPLLENIESLHAWYYSLVEELINREPGDKFLTLADEITRNCNSEFEMVTSLYYWVQSNIKYIAFEYGLGGYVPREPEKTLANRYGDCKDKTILLYSLLKAKGIESYLTWIGTNKLPYTYQEVPTPNTDNHMIVTYALEKSIYFLDGTSDYYPIGLPSQFIQGKEALVSKGKDKFEIIKVPVMPPQTSLSVDSIDLQIVDDSLIGNGKLNVSGYHKTNFYHLLINKSEQVKKKVIENNIMKGNNKFVLEEYSMTDIESFDPELEIEYTFNLHNYVQKIGHELYINMNLDQGWMEYKTRKDRENPVLLPYTTETVNIYNLRIPDGYEVEYMPEPIDYKSEHFSFIINYHLKDNLLVYESHSAANILLLEKDSLQEWNAFIDELETAYKQTILLKRNE